MRKILQLALVTAVTGLAAAGSAVAAAPTATTLAAGDVAATTATLNGTVSPNGEETTYRFEYGTTTAYGTLTPSQGPIQGNGDRAVSAAVTGLAPSTTYHFRVVATNPSGTVNGADLTFTTPAAGAATPVLTAATSRKTVVFGTGITIAGTLTGGTVAGQTITLESNPAPYTGGFKSTGLTTVTSATGAYSIPVSPGANTRYRVSTGAKKSETLSGEVQVRVRPKVTLGISDRTPSSGQRVWFRGHVTPGHDGKVARIQRRTASGTWRTVARTTLVTAAPVGDVARSKFAKRVRILKSGTYRVRVAPADGDHIAGISPRRSVTVG
jgi:hypothetical protein